MNKQASSQIGILCGLGILHSDALALRLISMTLHRWHELECGDSNAHASWCITRGRKQTKRDAEGQPVKNEKGKLQREFIHDEEGAPFIERHAHTENEARYSPTPDRERGAKRRLAKIMAKYPTLGFYVQTDPRGAALYILRPGDVPEGSTVDSCYSRGVAVFK